MVRTLTLIACLRQQCRGAPCWICKKDGLIFQVEIICVANYIAKANLKLLFQMTEYGEEIAAETLM